MALSLLTARAHRLLAPVIQQIGQAYAQGRQCILLVPEQFTLQAEIELIQGLDLPGFFDIQVLSPTRLAQRVFERAGMPAATRIDARGKAMVLRCVLDDLGDQLRFYHRAAGAQGFVERMGAWIADLKASDIDPVTLALSAQRMPEGRLRLKMADAACIYAEYERRMAGRFADGEDVERALEQRMGPSGVLADTWVWVYGFDMLTHTFAGRLGLMASLCPQVTVALVMDGPKAPDAGLYEPVAASAARLEALLDARGIPHNRVNADGGLDATPALRHLEAQLFAYPARRYPESPEGITLWAAPNPHAEAHQAAAQVLAWVRDEGYSLEDISLQYPQEGGYSGVVREVFRQYGIPAHVDDHRVAALHPLAQALLCALRCAVLGYRPDDVLGLLKSGFSPLSDEEAFLLENHALAYGLRGALWRRPLTRGDEAEREACEPLRQALAAPLEALREGLRAARDADASLRAVARLLTDMGAFDRLKAYQQQLEAAGLLAEWSASTQVWNLIMGTLSQMHALLEGRRPRGRELVDMLAAGLAATELKALPSAPGMLICGEIGRLRTQRVRALIVLGLCDPGGSASPAGLLDDLERLHAEKLMGAHMGMQDAHRELLGQLDLLLTLSLPKEKLCLSYPLADATGQALRPDMVISRLERIFPQLAQSGSTLDEYAPHRLCAPQPALGALAIKLREAMGGKSLEPIWAQAYAALAHMPDQAQALSTVVKALGARVGAAPLPPDTARRMARETVSISRLEAYATCPFKHFVHYQLAPEKRREYGVFRQDVGTFFHDALAAYVQQGLDAPGWPRLSREASDSLLQQAAQPLTQLWQEGPLGEDARAQARARHVLNTARRAAYTLSFQVSHSAFTPTWLERDFGIAGSPIPPMALPVPGQQPAYLRGRIDRVDTWRSEGGELYLRVVDYKYTGARPQLRGEQLYWGLQLQLMLYLRAALEGMPGSKPAGILYFQLADPLLESPCRDPERIAVEQFKALSLSGVTLGDPGVQQALFAPGSPQKRTSQAGPDRLEDLMDHARARAAELVAHMRAGTIDILPTQAGDRSPCALCDYRAICGIDPLLPGAKTRLLLPQRLDTVLKGGFAPDGVRETDMQP